MEIKGTGWYTAGVYDTDKTGKPYFFPTYRRSLEGMTLRDKTLLMNLGVLTKKRRSHRNHTGIPMGTPFLQVEDPQSVKKLEEYWTKKQVIKLDPHRYDAYLKELDAIESGWKSFLAWDIIQVASRDGTPVTTCRINLNHYSEITEKKLKKRLEELGIRFAEKEASKRSESINKGDSTLRIDPACVQRLEKLFLDAPVVGQDWRNLNNWDSIKGLVDKKGTNVPYLRFCINDMRSDEKKHLQESLKACGVSWAIEIEEKGEFARVMGTDNVKKLHQVLSPWTPQQGKTRMRLDLRESR